MQHDKSQSIKNARTLLRRSELGILSTHSKACDGFPFGSVSTFLSTHEGHVVFYISELAQHTKNIDHNPKMCLTVFDGTQGELSSNFDDPNAGARLTLIGSAARLPDDERKQAIKQRFFTLYPDSIKYENTHDFDFFEMRCERVRFIGGFGDIHWVSTDQWLLDEYDWADAEQGMIEHMNEDHADAMQLISNHQLGIDGSQFKMLAVTPDGYFYTCDNSKPLFIPFANTANTGKEVREELVAMTHQARAAA